MTIKKRMTLLFFVDSLIVLFSIYIGYFILHPNINVFANKMLLISVTTIQIAYHTFAWHYGLYRKAWSYESIFKRINLNLSII